MNSKYSGNYQMFYRDVHRTALQLDPALAVLQADDPTISAMDIRRSSQKEIWLTSLSTRKAVNANVDNAAMWIVSDTHRLATPEEMKAELDRREAASVEIRRQDKEAKGRNQPELEALAASIHALATANQNPKKGTGAQQGA